MVSYALLLFLLTLQGSLCIRFLTLQEDGIFCNVEFEPKNGTKDEKETQMISKKCIFSGYTNAQAYDYHFNKHNVYYEGFDSTYLTVLRLRLGFSSEKKSSVNANGNRIATKLAVDWVRDTFYVINGNVSFGSVLQSDQVIDLETVITVTDLLSLTNQTTMYIVDVRVDPYEQLLFVLSSTVEPYNYVDPKKTFIFSSDLKGKGLKIVQENQYAIQDVHFNIDVSEKSMYLTHKKSLYKYSYEGSPGKMLLLPYNVKGFSVLGNKLYMVFDILYEIDLNYARLQQRVAKKFDPQLNLEYYGQVDFTFKVLDVRVQRRKQCGKFLCDRTDCPYLCEVRPTGDTCVCRETDAKDRDGVTCYTCGQSNLTSSSTQPTIVNGDTSSPGYFPWHAVLYNTRDWEAFCGGTLITSSVVLTAAHCVTIRCEVCRSPVINVTDLIVALGKTSRAWEITELATIRTNVTRILVNEDYVGPSLNYDHDIALLYLNVKIKPSSYVMPACLDYNLNQLPTQTAFTGYIPGFGFTEECGASCSNMSDTLMYTTAPVMSFSDCYKASNMIHSFVFHKLTSDKICIGNGTVSPIQKGDSGGGLTLTYRGLHYVVGVVSHKLLKSEGFHLEYSFGALTNVNQYMSWIKQNIPEGA